MKFEGQDWFYSATVKEHFLKPKNVLKNEREIKNYNGYGKVGNMKCGDIMELWIKIEKGIIKKCKWRTFGSIHPQEKVLMSDYTYKAAKNIKPGNVIIDGNGKKNLVETKKEKDYSGKLITIFLSTSKFYNFTVTPNHPIQIIKRNQVSMINRLKGTHWSEVSQKKIDFAESQIYSASELRKSDFVLFGISKFTKDSNELTKELCTLLGYYVSNGGIPSKNRVIFYFGLGEQKYIKEIETICKKNKWKTITYKRNTENVYCIQINEPKIAAILRKHGGESGNKKFSETVLVLPKQKQLKIINSYVNGDGWTTQQNKNWEPQFFISTSNEIIANQLQMMLARNKIFAPLHYREPRKFVIKGKTYKNKGEINLVFRKNTKYSRIKFSKKENAFLIPISKIIETDYNGKIVDLSLIETPNTYKIKGISIHNCASAIASTSMLSLMITENGGMKIKDALKITGKDITERLKGLPQIKIHCSVLGDEALREAIKDYEKKQEIKNSEK